jgi:hypothetical protein
MNSSDISRNCAPRTLAASRSRIARAIIAPACLLAWPLAFARPVAAQAAPRSIEGRISLPGPTPGGIGVGGAWVVLHRVGPDTAGPLDSMRTAPSGAYRFRYRPFGDSLAVYFVSTSRGGVNYFTPPVREAAVRGGMADLVVFDTSSAPIPINVRGRHLIITVPDSSTRRTRTIVEAFELSNDSTVTRVARGADGVTFDAALPPNVAEVRAGQGDISEDAIRAVDGRVTVNAPFSPGLRQMSFSYEIPVSAEPFEVLVETPTTVLEVLVEDPGALVQGAGLVPADPVEIDGRPFKRFLAQDVSAAQTFSITIPPATSASRLRLMLIVTAVGAAMLLGLGMVMLQRGPGRTRRREDDVETLALEAAALDEAFERIASPTDAQKAEHYLARARAKSRLSAALAKRDGLT